MTKFIPRKIAILLVVITAVALSILISRTEGWLMVGSADDAVAAAAAVVLVLAATSAMLILCLRADHHRP